jgi:hypothetical protein
LSETPDNSPTIRAFLEHLFLREAIIPVPEELRIKAERILAEYQKAMGEMQDLHEFIFS